MTGNHVKVSASGGGEFDCYLSLPAGNYKSPAIVLASAVHGVDIDIQNIADEFAAAGYIAAAPDLFWRTVPGPLVRGDERTGKRSQPRLPVIKTGEADMADTLAMVKKFSQHNGKTVAMGFCFGGPYAVLGPKRLGYDAGIGCHSTQMMDFIQEFDGLVKPVCLIWGDEDHAAPPEVRTAYLDKARALSNLEVHVFPGIQHGYMMPGGGAAYSAETRKLSMEKALGLLKALK